MNTPYTFTSSLSDFNAPLRDLQNRRDNLGKRLVVGVAIVRRDQPSGHPQVLLIQRAAHEQLYPDMYELPGGKCEEVDNTLLDTAVRETFEETAFRVTRILAEFPGFEYSTAKGDARQFNFVVEVDGGSKKDPVLDPNEHQAFAWADEDDYKSFHMSEAMQGVVADALLVAGKVSLRSSTSYFH